MSLQLDNDLGIKAQGPQGVAGKDGHSVWINIKSDGPNKNGQWFNDLVNASASNPPKVNDIMINAEGNMAMITVVNITNKTDHGGGTFNYGSWVGNIKGPKGEAGKIYKPYVNENGDLHAKLINPDGTDATA